MIPVPRRPRAPNEISSVKTRTHLVFGGPAISDAHTRAVFPKFQSLRYFPLVGLLVGGLQSAFLLWLLVWFPLSVSLVMTMGLGLLLTGGFHEDGWADVCDGMGGGYTPEKILTIMKDSRVGAYGAMGLTWMLLAKFVLLTEIAPEQLVFSLLLSHAFSRLCATLLIVIFNHVGDAEHSKTKPLGNQMRISHWLFSFALAMLAFFCCYQLAVFAQPSSLSALSDSEFWLLTLTALVPMLLVASVCGVYFKHRIGGYTGDCLGATQQLCELTCYLVLCAFFAGVAA